MTTTLRGGMGACAEGEVGRLPAENCGSAIWIGRLHIRRTLIGMIVHPTIRVVPLRRVGGFVDGY
jgi:hypothetical protein